MNCDSHSIEMINSATHLPISVFYRQSLQPYVDPEMLEIGYYQPKMADTQAIALGKVAKPKYQYPKAIVLLLLVTSCFLGYGFEQKNAMAAWLSTWQISNVSSR